MSITVRGSKELAAKLRKLNSFTNTRRAVQLSALHVKGKVAEYPPSTPANVDSGPGSTWYERGFGTKYHRVRGGVTGRKTSQTLGRKWTTASKDNGMTAVVGNNVTYGPFVQGDKQAGFHKDRNWKTVEIVLKEEIGIIMRYIAEGVRKDLG